MLLCSQPRSIGFGDTYFGGDSDPKNMCTCGVPFLECPPRVESQTEIQQGGIKDFSWATATPVPTPRWISGNMRKHWPLSRSISLAPVMATPTWLRRRLFRKYYLENRLMLSGLARSGQYDYYFDGCKDPVRLELLKTELSGLKVIHIVRHPGAFVYHFHRLGYENPEKRLSQWIRYHSRIRSIVEDLDEKNYLAVTYEYVVEDTGSFLRDVANFLGMEKVDDSPPFLLKRSEIHIQGNSMRKTADRVLNMANKWRGNIPDHMDLEARATLQQLPWAAAMYDNS